MARTPPEGLISNQNLNKLMSYQNPNISISITQGDHLSLYQGKPTLISGGALSLTHPNLYFKIWYFMNGFIWLPIS